MFVLWKALMKPEMCVQLVKMSHTCFFVILFIYIYICIYQSANHSSMGLSWRILDNVTSTLVKGRPPPPYFFFLRGGLLCNSKSNIPTLPQGFCKVLTSPLFSDGLMGSSLDSDWEPMFSDRLWWDLHWILIENLCLLIDFDGIIIGFPVPGMDSDEWSDASVAVTPLSRRLCSVASWIWSLWAARSLSTSGCCFWHLVDMCWWAMAWWLWESFCSWHCCVWWSLCRVAFCKSWSGMVSFWGPLDILKQFICSWQVINYILVLSFFLHPY